MNLFFGDRPGRPRVTRPYKDDDVWQVQQVVRFSIENANSPSCLLPLDTGQTLELLLGSLGYRPCIVVLNMQSGVVASTSLPLVDLQNVTLCLCTLAVRA